MPTVKAIFGLGITTPNSARCKLDAYKSVSSVGYVDSSCTVWPKDPVVVVAGLNVFARFASKMRRSQVLVVSDVPALLRSVEQIVPLDYTNKVSYLFHYIEPDFSIVTKAMKKETTVDVVYNSVDQLGFVVNNLRRSDTTINAFIGLLNNIPFTGRGNIYFALEAFFTAETPNIDPFITVLNKEAKDSSLDMERDRLIQAFCEKADDYHKAYNSKLSAAQAAEKFGVDAYALSYFSSKINGLASPKRYLAKQPKRKSLNGR